VQCVWSSALFTQNATSRTIIVSQRQKQVLGADVIVPPLFRLLLGSVEQVHQPLAQVNLSGCRRLWKSSDFHLGSTQQSVNGDAQFLQDTDGNAVTVPQQRDGCAVPPQCYGLLAMLLVP
jgi:hypothetical protein